MTETLTAVMAADMERSSLSLSAAPVEIKAADAPEGEPKPRTFSIKGYTGAPMEVEGFYHPIVLEMSGLQPASQTIPAFRQHDPNRIVGQTTSIKVGEVAEFEGNFTGDSEDTRQIIGHAKDGFKWQASVGASIDRREFLDAGKSMTVNGRTVNGPMLIVRAGTIKEISFVPLGADGQTSASVAASRSLGTGGGSPMTGFDDWLKAKGFDPAALSDTQKAPLMAQYVVDQQPPGVTKPDAQLVTAGAAATTPGPETYEGMVAARRANLARQNMIAEISARWMDDRPGQIDEIDHLTKMALASKTTSADQFELTLIRELRAGHFGIHRGESSRDGDTNSKTVEAAVAQSLRLPNLEKHYDERSLDLADRRWKSNVGLKELLQVVAMHNGNTRVSTSDLSGLLRAAYARRDIQANAGFSTLDISLILSNVGNKMVKVAFEGVESAWRRIAAIERLNDFKSHTMLSLTGDLQYEKVGAAGEIPHGKLGETPYTLQADIYGKMLAITERDLVNDDLGALNRVATRLGRGAALKINETFWTAFLANRDTFWASGNANVISGGSTVLSSASLKTALEKFRKQTDPDSKPLGITPTILLVPPELEITADELMTSTVVNTGGSSTTDKVPNRNIWQSKFEVVMSTYLSNTAITNYSLTHWWLLANPADLATIAIGFLYGREMPMIESAEADFDTLGIRYRGTHRFGVNKQEYRASVRSAGA